MNLDVKRASSVHFPVNTFLLGPCSRKTFFEKLVNSRIGIRSAEIRKACW